MHGDVQYQANGKQGQQRSNPRRAGLILLSEFGSQGSLISLNYLLCKNMLSDHVGKKT